MNSRLQTAATYLVAIMSGVVGFLIADGFIGTAVMSLTLAMIGWVIAIEITLSGEQRKSATRWLSMMALYIALASLIAWLIG